MKEEIKKAINTTLVIDNKQSIDLCVAKIAKICDNSKLIKDFKTVYYQDETGKEHKLIDPTELINDIEDRIKGLKNTLNTKEKMNIGSYAGIPYADLKNNINSLQSILKQLI